MADTVCHHGDTRAALALIESNADLETRASFSELTPLHIASERGHGSIVSALVKSNADIDAIDRYGETPAIINANIEHRGHDGRTPLFWASLRGNIPALKALLAAGADLEARAISDATTPLQAACGYVGYSPSAAAITVLVESNADIEAVDHNGETALCIASRYGTADVARILIRSNANIEHSAKYTEFFVGCKYTISNYADSNPTPLFIACIYNQPGVLKALLAAGAVRRSGSRFKSPEITQILADAAAPWSPGSHFLRGFPARSIIKTLLLCAQRIYLPAWPVVMAHIT
jgi:ankyrin repeat protein